LTAIDEMTDGESRIASPPMKSADGDPPMIVVRLAAHFSAAGGPERPATEVHWVHFGPQPNPLGHHPS